MADRITLTGLKVRGFHGVYEHERRDGQDFVVDATLWLDSRPAAASDDLADTVDYGLVCQHVEQLVVGGTHTVLLEALAEKIAKRVLGIDERITGVTVALRKLRPPVPQDLATSGVRIMRRR